MNLKQKKTVLFVCLVAILLLSAFSVKLLLSTERPAGEEYKTLAEQILNQARQEFETIRGTAVREVTLEVVNQSWVEKTWGTPSASELEKNRIDENIFKALFMISQDENLTEINLQWTGMFYAAKWMGKIYAVEENFDITDEFKATSTFVHELTHIMQDDFSLPSRTTFDGSKALSSLKEGDATLMADTFKNDGVVPAPAEVVKPGASSLPFTVNRINRFVYRYGLEFVKALYTQSGWQTVDEAYANPPTTTEQIMHPEKYFTGEGAQAVEAASIGGEWELTKTDNFGEYFILVMLDNWIPESDAEAAAEGWGGDVVSYYESDDDFVFTWNICWDSEDDAHEFYIAFQEMMYETSAEKQNCSHWSADGRYISVKLDGNSTLITSATDESMVL